MGNPIRHSPCKNGGTDIADISHITDVMTLIPEPSKNNTDYEI